MAPKKKMYDIDEIVAKRVSSGKIEYLVKWHDFPTSDNTWEPMSNLRSCRGMVDAFEAYIQGLKVIETGNGFDRNWRPIRVIGVKRRPMDSRLMVIVEWEGMGCSVELADVANERIPDLVIAYYEQRIKWKRSGGLEPNLCLTVDSTQSDYEM